MIREGNTGGVTHWLKTWPSFFRDIAMGKKTAELRVDDRDFDVDDGLYLCEWDPLTKKFTGEIIIASIGHLASVPNTDLVVLSLRPPTTWVHPSAIGRPRGCGEAMEATILCAEATMTRRNFEECVAFLVLNIAGGVLIVIITMAIGGEP